jgi:hypothetical protein
MALHFCNPMTCGGLGFDFLGGCSMVWVGAVVLFFIIIFSKRYIAEAIGMPWSPIGSFGLGYLALIGGVVFTCSPKLGLLFGIIGSYVGAYFGGFIDGSGGY